MYLEIKWYKMIETEITKIESEFRGIYRIHTKDGMILDIKCATKDDNTVKVGNKFKYLLSIDDKDSVKYDKTSTIMSDGIVYHINSEYNYISFGGLLCRIPKNDLITSDSFISIVYSM